MLKQIQETVETLLGPVSEFVFLLGSAGTDRFQEKTSDIDLAVFFIKKPTHKELFKIKNDLEDILIKPVDLVSLNEIDPIFAHQVLETGRVLYNHNPQKLLEWKAKQMSVYPDFKFSRKVIEDSLLKRKKYV